MTAPRAVVFDLGGTLVHWADWDEGAPAKWGAAHDALRKAHGGRAWPDRVAFIDAMRAAEKAHWKRVDPDDALLATMDGYAKAVAGWSTVFPDSRDTLRVLKDRGYRLGLLSNTWWAAEWHNADIAAHGLADLLDEIVYTSDLPHSKPHPSVFREIGGRLGVELAACVMIGDRQIDDVAGAKATGMRGVWRRNDSGFPLSDVTPDAIVDKVSELPPLLKTWGGK